MTREILRRIKSKIQGLRSQAANLKTADLVTLAKSLERTEHKAGHFVFQSPLPSRRSVAIPNHPSRPMGRGLALKILNQLEGDIDAWDEWLNQQERNKKIKKAKGNGHV